MKVPSEHLLQVVMNGRVIGDIQRTGPRQVRLVYSVSPAHGTPLSLTLPRSTSRHRGPVISHWLSGLLPDRPETLRQWRRQFGVTDGSVFELLRHVGEDVAGAAQFVRPERLDVVTTPGRLLPMGAADIADMLRRALADLPLHATDTERGKFSLAGAQAKIALHHTGSGWCDPSGSVPSTHILKPAIPRLPDQDLVEAVTMRAAAGLGLRVARCSIQEFDTERALVVTRFDRTQRGDERWVRVHQEDMCQAMGLWPERKYEKQGGPTASAVADLIRHHSERAENDVRAFVQALIFNWLTCGTDAHARNYSFLLSGDVVRLAPLYDLNSHLAYSTGNGNELSMSTGGTYRADQLSIADWVRFAPALHVSARWLRTEIHRQRSDLVAAVTAAAESEDVARYDTPTIPRLIANVRQWLSGLN